MTGRILAGTLCCLLLCLSAVAVGAGTPVGGPLDTLATDASVEAQSDGPSIVSLDYTGDSSINGTDSLVLWRDGNHTFEALVDASQATGQYELCLDMGEPPVSNGSTLSCSTLQVNGTGQKPVTLTVSTWPSNESGEQTVTATLRNPENGSMLSQRTLELVVLDRDGDFDDDGLSNQKEVQAGTDLNRPDTDGDGLSDQTEVSALETDPLATDSDDDGLSDGAEVEEYKTDPTKADTDGDGLADGREVNEIGSNPNKADSDDDGLTDQAEVSTYNTDPTTADTDGDSLSDEKEVKQFNTDPLSRDTDDDALPDGDEIHVYGTSPTTTDTDGDGLSDRQEVKEYQSDPTKADTDDDGLTDGAEIKTYGTSAIKADSDGDGFEDGREVEAGLSPTDPEQHPKPHFFETKLGTNLTTAVGVFSVLFGGFLLFSVAQQSFRTSSPEDVFPERAPFSLPGGGSDDTGTDHADADGSSAADQEPPPASATADTEPQSGAFDDQHLLTNEERVQQLLETNGGRLHQSEIVAETEWSKSKVSRVLSQMADDGQVSKIPLGKENLIAMPDDVPEGAKPPHRPGDDRQ